MTFSNLLMGSLRTVNAATPEKRAAILPVRDVGSFREAVAGLRRVMQRPEFAQAAQAVNDAGKVLEIDPHTFAPPSMEMS